MYVCADIPLSVGILDPRASPTQLNAVEFLWDPAKRASAFIQVSKQKGFGGGFSKPAHPEGLDGSCLLFKGRELKGENRCCLEHRVRVLS